MPAYHSSLNGLEGEVPVVSGVPFLPLNTKTRGPAFSDTSLEYDIVDESIRLFKPNCFFRNFEIKGNADRLLIYGILFISECLNLLKPTTSLNEAQKAFYSLSVQNFTIPGDRTFSLSAMYLSAGAKHDSELLRQYLLQFRQEIAARLPSYIYSEDISRPSKWWLAFQKRRFMGKSL
ncbi:hypothetical protein BB560_007053 [Smittium megazygosporum]|uniref:Actin-related protein 2/3 complex subunit 3 n=1 Tax=Smittium megazygosporum TaxID=133381 RepID=A0A2T9XZ99_9FUNG|nr:hypothetical protein BB560_007053 [Smittium megazygosporum]